MKSYILIIIISKYLPQSGSSAVSAEFNSLQACKLAEISIKADIKRTVNDEIISSGCYEK